jgi:hypothetical protein
VVALADDEGVAPEDDPEPEREAELERPAEAAGSRIGNAVTSQSSGE